MAKQIKSQEDIDELLASGVKPQPLDAPAYYVSSVRMSTESNNVSMIFSRNIPVTLSHATADIQASKPNPVAVLDMSAATAKDLLVLLEDQIAHYEKEWGVIETAFTRRKAAKN